ncbi:MAG: threonine/serine exporter family protein, partial [Chloroflexales bacterium]|nr:threonine/serine exporter family protein [Chloroflexales bacterium]
AHIIVLTTGLWIQIANDAPAHLAERPLRGTGLRLDQISIVYRLADTIERGGMDLAAATEKLSRITAAQPRLPAWVNFLGHTILVLGLALIFQPTPISLLSALVAGTFVGLLRLVSRRMETLEVVLPVLAAFLVTLGAFTLIDFTPEARPLRLLIPPLVTFLPGAALTLSVVELAYGDITSGSSRLIAGILQVALLYFGIAAAVQLLGVPSAQIGQSLALNQIGWYAPPLGVAIFGLGVFLFFSAPQGALPWILLSLYAAWFGQQLGTALFGAELSGFVGGLVMALVVLVSERIGGPPAFVAFLPAFWLLVPGAAALISLTELASGGREVGSAPLIDTAIAITAIALGVLVGAAIYRGLARLVPTAR